MKLERFAALIAPVTVEEFFETIDGRAPHHIPGDIARHQSLFDWEGLNRFLNQHLRHLQHPVLRLALGGKIVPSRELTDEVTTVRRGTFQRFSQKKIEQKLADGATLIVNGIDDFDESLGDLRDTLSSELGERVQINAYYSPGGIVGFDPHYDTHDVFVLQVEGSKKWEFFGETIKFPLECQPSSASDCPAEVLETLTMRKGDVLYIPRGHWHSVCADTGPSLHLTLGVYHKTRVDAIVWLLKRAKHLESMRQNATSVLYHESFKESMLCAIKQIEEILSQSEKIEDEFKKDSMMKLTAGENCFMLPNFK